MSHTSNLEGTKKVVHHLWTMKNGKKGQSVVIDDDGFYYIESHDSYFLNRCGNEIEELMRSNIDRIESRIGMNSKHDPANQSLRAAHTLAKMVLAKTIKVKNEILVSKKVKGK